MGFINEIEKAGEKVGKFLTELVTGAKNLQKIYGALSGPTIAASMAVFYDTVKAIAAAESAASAAANGNVLGTITLSETTIGLVKSVVKDAISGEKIIVADFEALNIKLSDLTKSAPAATAAAPIS